MADRLCHQAMTGHDAARLRRHWAHAAGAPFHRTIGPESCRLLPGVTSLAYDNLFGTSYVPGCLHPTIIERRA